MQMEFETDRQRRDLIYDCVKLLAQAKSVPIYAKATGRGVGDNCYHVTMADKTVAAHVLATKYSTKFLGQAEFIVKVLMTYSTSSPLITSQSTRSSTNMRESLRYTRESDN